MSSHPQPQHTTSAQFIQQLQQPLQPQKVSPARSVGLNNGTRSTEARPNEYQPERSDLSLPPKYKRHLDVVAGALQALFTAYFVVEPGIPSECCFIPKFSEEAYEIVKVAQVESGVTTYVQLCDGFLVLQCRKPSSTVRPCRLILPPPKKRDTCYSLLLFLWSNNQFLHLGVVYNLPKATPEPSALVKTVPPPSFNPLLHNPPEMNSKSVPLFHSAPTTYTTESAWYAMAHSAPTVTWGCVTLFISQMFNADISSWSELMVCDKGNSITKSRWLQLCSFLSSPISEVLEVLQSTIDDINSPYNFGFIGRITCEQILSKQKVRAFLIRFSDSTPGMCAGSLNTGQGIYHLRIFRRWPDEHATYVDSGGSVKYARVRGCQPCWYVVQKENEKPAGLAAPTLRALVETALTQFLNVCLLSRADAHE
ncbi:hypothetical protein Pelo_7201 [Pelomyxa schiedti]|nr:hypothetical protein Pelo_7201 [Pelomyxa schiedti]